MSGYLHPSVYILNYFLLIKNLPIFHRVESVSCKLALPLVTFVFKSTLFVEEYLRQVLISVQIQLLRFAFV